MPKALWLLVICMVINVTGASFLWPLNTIYIHQELGKSLSIAGFVLMLNAGAGVLGSLVGGYLFDKLGGYRTMIIGILITMISVFVLAFFHTWYFYVVLMVFIGFGAGLTFPAMYALAGLLWPEGGRKPFNAMYVAQNVGVSIGAALGGLVASYRFDFVFGANGLTYVIFLAIVFLGFRKITEARISSTSSTTNVFEQKGSFQSSMKLRALLTLCVGFLICWIAYVQWQSTVAVHTQNLGISLTQYSLLWTINGAMIVLAQPIISAVIKRWVHKLKAQICVGLSIFVVALFMLSIAEQFTGFIVAMVILTIGEMLVWPAVPTIAHDLAPEGKAGFYQGIVNSVATGGRMIGPLLGGVIADLYGMQILFYVLMSLFLIGFITTIFYDRKIKARQQNQEVKAQLAQ